MFSSVQHRFENALLYLGYGSGPVSREGNHFNRLPEETLENQALGQPQRRLQDHRIRAIGSHSEHYESKPGSIWQTVTAVCVGYLFFFSSQSSLSRNNLPTASSWVPAIGFTALSTSLHATEPLILPLTFMAGLSILPDVANAQSTRTSFFEAIGGTGGDEGTSILTTTEGDLIITGTTESFGAGDFDVLLTKFSTDGVLLWAKTLGGAGFDAGSAVTTNSEGDLFVTGLTNSFGAGSFDLLLAKFSSNGALLWAKSFGGVGYDAGTTAMTTSEGDLIIAGSTDSLGAGNLDLLLAKFSTDGTLLWTNTIGGLSNDLAHALTGNDEGDFFITGSTESFGQGEKDVLLAKFSGNGTLIWANTLGESGDDTAFTLTTTSEGDLIFAGSTDSFSSRRFDDVLLAKFSSDGNLLWSNILGGTDNDRGWVLRTTTEGGFIVVGYTYISVLNDVLLAKFSNNGTLLWANSLGGAGGDVGNDLAITPNGDLFITGFTSSIGAGSIDVVLAKLEAQGGIENCAASQNVMHQVQSITLTLSDVTQSMSNEAPTWTVQDIMSVLNSTNITNLMNQTTECSTQISGIQTVVIPSETPITISQDATTRDDLSRSRSQARNSTIDPITSRSSVSYDQSNTMQVSQTLSSSSSGPLLLNEILYGESIEIVVAGQVVGTFTFTGGSGTVSYSTANTLTLDLHDDFNPENGQEIILFITSEVWDDANIELVNTDKCENGEGYEASGSFTEENGTQTYSLIFQTITCTSTTDEEQTTNAISNSALTSVFLYV